MPSVVEQVKVSVCLGDAAFSYEDAGNKNEAVKQYKSSLQSLENIQFENQGASIQNAAVILRNVLRHRLAVLTNQKEDPQKVELKQGGGASLDDDKKNPFLPTAPVKADKNGLFFTDVVGLVEAKRVLKEAFLYPLRFPHLFTGKRKTLTTLLLFGPPGTGKTMLARAAANELETNFICAGAQDLFSPYVGESEKLICQLFEAARNSKPALLFIDEVDAFFRKRSSQEDEHSRRIKTSFLQEMTNPLNASIFILCCTNTPHDLDAAFIRRFHKRLYVPMPDADQRASIIANSLTRESHDLSLGDIRSIALQTKGFNGSDIEIVLTDALVQPLRELEGATYFVKSEHEGKTRITPCTPDTPGSFKSSIFDVQAEFVYPRPLNVGDLRKSLSNTKPSITEEDLKAFEKFRA